MGQKILPLYFILIILILTSKELRAENSKNIAISTLQYSKIDFPGCPENSLCSEETGKTRNFFKEQLKLLIENKTSTSKLNEQLVIKSAFPVPLFAKDTNHNYKGLALWESHCRQHSIGIRYYQGEIFVSSIDKAKWKNLDFIYNPLVLMVNGQFYNIPGLMGEAPLEVSFINKTWVATYLREEDGNFYLFSINTDGKIRIEKVQKKLDTLKTVNCPSALSAEFLRVSESASFYATTTCKEIPINFDQNKNATSAIVIFGVPCL